LEAFSGGLPLMGEILKIFGSFEMYNRENSCKIIASRQGLSLLKKQEIPREELVKQLEKLMVACGFHHAYISVYYGQPHIELTKFSGAT